MPFFISSIDEVHNSGAYYGCYSFTGRQLRPRCIRATTDSRNDVRAPIRYCVSFRCNKRRNILLDSVFLPSAAHPARVYLLLSQTIDDSFPLPGSIRKAITITTITRDSVSATALGASRVTPIRPFCGHS